MSISRDLSKFIAPSGQLEYDNTTSGLSATTIKSAIDELNTLLGGGNVGSQATFNVYEFTATASQTTFSLSSNHGQGSDITAGNFVDGTTYIITSVGTTDFVTLYGASSNAIGVTFTANTNPGTGTGTAKVVADYIPGFIKVYLNGVLLSETDYVASDGDNVVLDVGADVGALLSVVVLDSFNTATQLRVLGIDAGAPDNSVTVDASGNLDVTGTVTADGLTVDHSVDNAATFTRTSANTYRIEHDLNQFYFWNATTSEAPLIFQNDGDVIMNAGNVGIGTASPSAKLDIFDNAAGNANSSAIELTNYDYGVGETGQSVSIEALVRNDGGGSSTTGKIVFGKDSDYSSAANRDGNIQFYTNQSNSVTEAMRIDSAGNVGIKNSNPSSYSGDGTDLVIGTTSGDNGLSIISGTSGTGNIYFGDVEETGTGSRRGQIVYDHATDHMRFATAASEAMRIDASGNAIFTKSGGAYLQLKDASAVRGSINVTTSDGLIFTTGASFSERMRIDASGNVSIGDPDNNGRKVRIYGTGDLLQLTSTNAGVAGAQLDLTHESASPADGDSVGIINFGGRDTGLNGFNAANITGKVGSVSTETGELHFGTRTNSTTYDSSKMILDASGNLLVGTTSTSASVTGGRIFSTGRLVTSVNDEGHYFRRNTSDGTIVEFAKDGSPVGSIGSKQNDTGTGASYIYIAGGNTGLFFDDINNYIRPANASGGLRDNTVDLGEPDSRFKDLHTSGRGFFNLYSAGIADGNIMVSEGVYVGAANGNNQIRSSSAGAGSATLYIGNAAIQVSSDQRLKTNIVDTEMNATEKLNQVRVVDFNWDDPSDTSFNNRNARGKWTGVLAQELVEVLPFVVNAPRNEEDLTIDAESDQKWLVDQAQMVPVLIKAIQELTARIAALESN